MMCVPLYGDVCYTVVICVPLCRDVYHTVVMRVICVLQCCDVHHTIMIHCVKMRVTLCHNVCHAVMMCVTLFHDVCHTMCIIVRTVICCVTYCVSSYHTRVYRCFGADGACGVAGQDLLPFVWGSMFCLPVCYAVLPYTSYRLCECVYCDTC